MPEYRLYCIDGAGRFEPGRSIAADDDEQAVSYVLAVYARDSRCELWQGDRLVAEIPQLSETAQQNDRASLLEEARRCRESARAYAGRPEAGFLLRLARGFEHLARERVERPEPPPVGT